MGLWRSIRKNAALLTVSSLVMQSLSMLWQVWLAAHIGPAGIGLFQLIGSVGFLFITLAISGIRFSVTRLLAEEPGAVPRERLRRDAPVLRLRALFRLGAAVSFFLPSPLAFSGSGTPARYARRGALPSGACALERSVRVLHRRRARVENGALPVFRTFCVWGFPRFCSRRAAAATFPPCAQRSAPPRRSRSRSRLPRSISPTRNGFFVQRANAEPPLTPRMLRIALPLASSAYARSALNTFRQLLVPRGLRLSGLSSESALAGYGVINGMAMPVLLLPTCLPLSVAELLVPALTEMQVAGEHGRVRRSVREMLGKTFLLSLGAAAAFFVFARPLGMLLYGSAEAARFLRLLAPMVPFLYTDIVTDGCLKGLGQMMASMAFNIAEAALGLVLVWALLPRWALTGYLVTLYICEVFNFTLSLLRLRQIINGDGSH